MKWHARATAVLSALLVAIGFALLLKGAFQGKPLGLALGGLFVAVGAGRLYQLRQRR